MDPQRFDALLTKLAEEPRSRRGALRIVAATALAGLLARAGQQPAAAVCKQNRKPCDHGKQCCSGVCRGPRDRKKCRPAPGQGTCTIEKNACLQGEDSAVTGCGTLGTVCFCWVTARGASFCGRDFDPAPNGCSDCAAAGRVCVRSGPACNDQPFGCAQPCPG